MSKELGLHASIYRSAPSAMVPDNNSATRNGISARVDGVTVMDSRVRGPSEPSQKYPPVKIVERWVGTDNHYIHAEPIVPDRIPLVAYFNRKINYMFGGNYIKTSDSRFSNINRYPIPLHDRSEGRYNLNVIQDILSLTNDSSNFVWAFMTASGMSLKTATAEKTARRWRIQLFAWYVRRAPTGQYGGISSLEQALIQWRDAVGQREYRLLSVNRGRFVHMNPNYLSVHIKARIGNSTVNVIGYGTTTRKAYEDAYRGLRGLLKIKDGIKYQTYDASCSGEFQTVSYRCPNCESWDVFQDESEWICDSCGHSDSVDEFRVEGR